MIYSGRWSAIRRGRGDLPPIVEGLQFFGDLSSSRTSIVSGAVATLGDASGNARDFTQATGTKRPTYTASDANFGGRPSTTADGVGGGLIAASGLPAMGACTIYFVSKNLSTSVGARVIEIKSITANGTLMVLGNTSGYLAARYENPSGSVSQKTLTSTAGSAVHRVAFVGSLSSGGLCWTAYDNGTAGGAYDVSAATAGGTSASGGPHGLWVAGSGLGGYCSGTMVDQLIYSVAHTAAQVAQIDGWLKWRNGL